MAELGYHAASSEELDLVHRELMAVIDSSEHYNEHFRRYEKSRMSKAYLRALQRQDPYHVIVLTSDGQPGGALISGPECGAIFRYWSWIFPAHRQSRLGLHGMRIFDEHWDNGRFHKAYTWVRPENEVALALLHRYGYEQTALLRQQLFGQDYVVMERPYTKLTEGYDTGMRVGRVARIKTQIDTLLGR